MNLLSHYGLLVNCRNRLLNGFTLLSTPGIIAPPSVPSVEVIAGGTPRDSLLEELAELTKTTGIHCEVWHNTSYHIHTTPSPSVACHPRCLAPDHLTLAMHEFDSMLQKGTARNAEGPWSSALHLVPEDSG
jgi:hypothetical protein